MSTALRTRSTSMRDIFVYGASGTECTSEELKRRLLEGTFTEEDVLDPKALAELGHLVLLQNLLPDDEIFAEALLKLAIEASPKHRISSKSTLALAQYYVSARRTEEAQRLLNQYPKIDADYYEYLRAELLNPFTHGNEETEPDWLREFNRPFTANNLTPVVLQGDARAPFDRIECRVPESVNDPRLISVVLTSFEPDEAALRTSVNSILNQTWKNLELIIVDDCSGAGYRPIFDAIEAFDERIRVIHLAQNVGTYGARNAGYAEAHGDFITGQDDDDWSHPERLTEQIRYLDENPRAIGCRVTAVRCDEHLGRVRVGYSPSSENASSLLFRRDGYVSVGKYLPARKAADTEYHFRLEAVTGLKVGRLRAPLSIIRILNNSLSRGDFSPGWKHSARRSFRSSYELWHQTAHRQELRISDDSLPQVHVPRRFQDAKVTSKRRKLDVVIAGNWERFGGPQKSMLEEIHALVASGYRVGILNLEAARFMHRKFQAPLRPEIQELINDGYVDEIHYDDDIRVTLLVLRYPPILQFFTHDITAMIVEKMIIVANQAPAELDGRDIRYRVSDCHQTAQRAFSVKPVWVPQGPQVRKILDYYLEPPTLADFNMPGILNIGEWWHDRYWFRSQTPVVGRHSRDDKMKWPEDAAALKLAYPDDATMDVRVMGGVKTPSRVLQVSPEELNWVVYERDELGVRDFLLSLDYFVYFQHSAAVEAFGRAILEAIASGTLTILPRQFEEVFGPAAIYCELHEIGEVIHRFHSNFDLYRLQVEKAKEELRKNFSYASYEGLIRGILRETGV